MMRPGLLNYPQGFTPLHDTAFHRVERVDVAEVLLAAGADVNAKDDYGDTPLDKVKERGDDNMLVVLLQNAQLTKSAAQGGAGDASQ